jgi:hypothetical protein
MRTRWIAALLALLLVLAGCSAPGGGDLDSTPADGDGGVDTDMSRPDAAEELDAGRGPADDAGSADGPAVGPALTPGAPSGEGAPMMVRRVELEVLVEDVAAAASRARATVSGAGGWVQSEEVVPGTEDRPGHGSLVLRVPSSDLDGVITSLAELGEVAFTRSTAEDVTAQYRDVEARVATLEAGAERLRDLIADAPSVESIASLERELTQREAELDALKARMKVLEADVSRSTITLHLAEQGEDLSLLRQEEQTGFLAGLRAGWSAFVSSVTLVLTVAGAVLPFLALAALAGLPLLLWRRRRAGARTAAAQASSRQAGPGTHGLASQDDRPAAAAGDPDRPGGGRG